MVSRSAWAPDHLPGVPAPLTPQGLEGKLFSPFALTIIYALSAPLLLALTVIPGFASFVLKPASHGDPWLMRKLMPVDAHALDWLDVHPRAPPSGRC